MSAAADLLKNYQHVIANLHLVTGGKGIFDVLVDGELLYSKDATGRHAAAGEVLSLFEEKFAQEVTRFGS